MQYLYDDVGRLPEHSNYLKLAFICVDLFYVLDKDPFRNLHLLVMFHTEAYSLEEFSCF